MEQVFEEKISLVFMKIYLGADHRGFELKQKLKHWLRSEGSEVVDLGNKRFDPEDDFVDFAVKVAEQVAAGKGVGILFCGSGGMAIAANKIKGVRAVEVYNEAGAEHAKRHDRANVLTIAADMIDFKRCRRIVEAWLKADFKQEAKYKRRLRKIGKLEQRYFK